MEAPYETQVLIFELVEKDAETKVILKRDNNKITIKLVDVGWRLTLHPVKGRAPIMRAGTHIDINHSGTVPKIKFTFLQSSLN
jgi:hypothetical protein